MGDAAVGQGHGQAERVVDRPGQRDGPLTAGPGVVVVAQQPVGVCCPGRGLHVGPCADAQRHGSTRQLGGKLQVTHCLRWPAEADGRPADGEVSRAAQLGIWVDEGQGAGGRLVAIGRAPLDES
jgi:hypothetical protein